MMRRKRACFLINKIVYPRRTSQSRRKRERRQEKSK